MLSSYQRAKILLSIGLLACFLLFWYAGTWLRIPRLPGCSPSLLAGGGIGDLLLVAATFGIALLIGSAIAGRTRFDAGLFCAAAGMSALSMRGGPLRYALFGAAGPSIYITLSLELIVLYVFLGLGWLALHPLAASGLLRAEAALPADQEEPLDQRFLATAAHALAMIIILMLLEQTDAKAQSIASVAIASYCAALVAHHFIAARPSVWFWGGPLLVGLIGYIAQFISPNGWLIGETGGFFAPLARPVPLDYASVGPAAAMLGYWTSQRWQAARADAEGAPAAA